MVVDFITPETETSIWYFWGMARNFKPDDAELTASIREGQGKIFGEDREMLDTAHASAWHWAWRWRCASSPGCSAT